MRSSRERIEDIAEATEFILRSTAGKTQRDFLLDEALVSAVFYKIVVIGEAVRTLVDDRAPFIERNADLPWRGWIGLRNIVVHAYFRTRPEIVWTDIESGILSRLGKACRDWLGEDDSR